MMIIVTKRRRYEETRGEAKQRDFLNLSNYYLLSFISLSLFYWGDNWMWIIFSSKFTNCHFSRLNHVIPYVYDKIVNQFWFFKNCLDLFNFNFTSTVVFTTTTFVLQTLKLPKYSKFSKKKRERERMNNSKFNFENEWNCIVESIWEQYVTVIHIYSNKI